MHYRIATLEDVPTLLALNRQLVEDTGHRNRIKPDIWFEERMRGFLAGEYTAVLFEQDGQVVAYALYGDHPDHKDTIYLRQLCVDRAHRRRGIGREAIRILNEEIWPPGKRITLGVLAGSTAARALYEATGFKLYALEYEIPASARTATLSKPAQREEP